MILRKDFFYFIFEFSYCLCLRICGRMWVVMVEVECWSWVKAVLEIVDNSPSSSWLICVFALFTFVLISFVFLLLFRFDNDDSGIWS
jgi:hypothetical protein